MPRSRWNPESVAELLADLEAVHGRNRFIPRFEPMEELISCILSQHTSDINSFPAFTRLRTRWPNWEDLMNADPGEVTSVIWNAGLAANKTKLIQACLREIYARTGEISLWGLREMSDADAKSWLLSLPGVGPKTASIVLSFAFDRHAIPVDTHVYRVGWRVGLWAEHLGESKAHDRVLQLVPRELAFRFHLALIQHGRAVCRAPLPQCGGCPISDRCRWFRLDGPGKAQRKLQRARRQRSRSHPTVPTVTL